MGRRLRGILNYGFSEKYLQICGMNGFDNHLKLRYNDVQLNSGIPGPDLANRLCGCIYETSARARPNSEILYQVNQVVNALLVKIEWDLFPPGDAVPMTKIARASNLTASIY